MMTNLSLPHEAREATDSWFISTDAPALAAQPGTIVHYLNLYRNTGRQTLGNWTVELVKNQGIIITTAPTGETGTLSIVNIINRRDDIEMPSHLVRLSIINASGDLNDATNTINHAEFLIALPAPATDPAESPPPPIR
jgi:hypothetical protein